MLGISKIQVYDNKSKIGIPAQELLDKTNNSNSTTSNINGLSDIMEEFPITNDIIDVSPEILQTITEKNKVNGMLFTAKEQEEISQKKQIYEEEIKTITSRNQEINTLIKSLDLGFNPTTNHGLYDNLKIKINNLTENDIVYTPYTDESGRTKYYRLTIKEFAEYIAATDNGYKFFYEDNDGNLIFDYESAKAHFYVNDNTADERSRLQYEELNNQYIKYIEYNNELLLNEQIKQNLEQNINLEGYNYLQTTDKFINYFNNYSGSLDEEVEKILSTSEGKFNRIIINLDYLTEEQKKMIIYLSNTNNGNMIKYLEDAEIQNQINNAIGAKMAYDYINSLAKDKNGNLTPNALNDIKTILIGLENGGEGFLEGLNFAINGTEGEITATSYEQIYILQYLSSQDLIGSVLGIEYNISSSIGNMLIPIEASAIMGYLSVAGIPKVASEIIGNTFFGTSIYGNTYNQGLQNGLTESQARLKAIISASSETTAQFLLGGLPGLSHLYSSKSFFSNILSEGIEEGTQEILENVVNSALTGKKIDISQMNEDTIASVFYGMATSFVLGAANKTINLTMNGIELKLTINDMQKIDDYIGQGYNYGQALEILTDNEIQIEQPNDKLQNLEEQNPSVSEIELFDEIFSQEEQTININEDIAEVKEVSKLDMSISKFDRYAVNTNQSYQNYDYVIKPKTDLETIIREISESNNKSNILIELDNINELNLELLENTPDNVSIRISNYTNEDYKVFKHAPNGSANATLQHLTYSVAELKEIINKIDIIESNINPQWNDYQKAQYVYEYLKDNIRYKSNPPGSILREKQFDGLMSLVAEESTCQGFAHTYSIILNRLGIDTTEVWGSLDGEGQHAYNIVTIDGNSFIVDTVREALEKKSPGKYTNTGFGVENTNQYVAKNHIDLYSAVNSNIETIKSYLGNYNSENKTRFQNFEEISLENIKNINSDTLEINGEIYSTKDIEQYLIEKQNIQIQKQNIEIQQKRLNEYKENLKQKYNISEIEAQKIMNILISGRYNPRFIQNTIKTNDYNEAIDIYDEFENLGLSEISNYKDIISKLNTLEKRTPSPIEIKNIIEQLKTNNNLDSNLAYLRTVSPELKQKLLQDINFKEYFLEEILSTKNPWYNFRDSYNSINNVLEISEIFTLLSNNELLKDLSQEKQTKLSTLYASMFSKDSETTWRNALENDTIFKSIINNASDYYSIIQINDYKLLLSVINKINENQINFDYYGSLSNIENIYKLLNEPLADDVIVRIVKSSNKEVAKEFFKNNPKAIDLYSKFNINTLLSYSENGVVFNEKILKRADFFEMLKSDNLIEFRSNIDKLYKNNASIDIEERITKYYQELLNNYDFKTEMFRQYSNEEVVWNSNGKDYIIDYTARELCMNGDIEGLKQLTSQKISEIIIDALFKDNIYNVRINITEMLRYNNQLSEENKILDKNTVQLYEAILNIDGLSSRDKINLYNILKEKNMNLKFYEDIRKLKDVSYDNIKQDMVKLSEHNELINQELSLQTGTTVYDFRNQEFIALVRELRRNYNEITNNQRECFSLISNNNTSTIGNGIIYGYNTFDNDYIVHMSETDSYSSDSRDSNFATNYPNRIATSSQLAESYFGISEINIATKKLNNGKYASLKPDFILSKNEITTEEIRESQRLGIPIMLISENTSTSNTNELETSAMTDKTKEYSHGYDMYLQQKIENRLKNIKEYNEEDINDIFNSAKNIAQER